MDIKKRKKKKAISPVVATVLLIAIVIAIALIIFLWFKGTIKVPITKFGENIELVCQQEVNFEASYSPTGSRLQIVNSGDTPLFSIKVRMYTGGDYETDDIKNIDSPADPWPGDGLKQGGTFSSAVNIGDADKLLLIPVLLGNSDEGAKSFECDDSTGVEVLIG